MVKKIVKFSKSYNSALLYIKKSFLEENKKNLSHTIKFNKLYKKNPKRTICKNCEKKLLQKLIQNFGVDYYVCGYCKHLNGIYQDTEKFNSKLYASESGGNYSHIYEKAFDQRVKNIYLPKVNFLKRVIKEKIKLIDLGSGAGHFLKALENKKIEAIGYEPNEILKNIGTKKLKKNKIFLSNLDDVYNLTKNNLNFNTIALIGTLEHLQNPNLFLKNFNKSRAKYLYISVPLFSLSVFLENSFTNVFPRQLGYGHTHLYTKESLEYMAKKNRLEVIGEWWFGTDFPDLHRSLINSANYLNKTLYLKELNKKFFSVINELQNVLDKNKICSEVHMVLKKK